MAAAVAADAEDVISALDKKVGVLEEFAIRHRLSGSSLPSLPPVREYRTIRALHNAVEAAVVRIENIAAALPTVVSTGRSHIHAKLVNYDPGEKFHKALQPPLQQLLKASTAIAALSKEFGPASVTVAEQTRLFLTSVAAEAALISKASKMAKPGDPRSLEKECQELVEASAEAAELKYDVDVHSPLRNHTMALADASAALGWVVSPAPLKHARDYKVIVNTLAEDILSRYIELGCNPVHSDFAESLNATIDALFRHVEEEHPAGLRWNYAQGATPLGYRRAQRNMRKDAHPIGDFYKLMHSGLTEYVVVSRLFGGVLRETSEYTKAAYEEMAKVIETASGRPRPDGDIETALKMLLMPVQHELTPLIAMLDKVPREDKLAAHCQVIREFMHMLQWCSATVQKMSSVGYIIDIEAVTMLYVDKLERAVCVDDSYRSQLNRQWLATIRKMMAEMKDYVKIHHPNELMFGTRRSRKSFDENVNDVSVSKDLKQLRQNSRSSKWKQEQRMITLRGRRSQVWVWVKAEEAKSSGQHDYRKATG